MEVLSNERLNILDIGRKKYAEVLNLQEELFYRNVDAKLRQLPTENHLILCEHEPVYTLGKSGDRQNILVSNEEMNADFFHTNRGGDVTFHGPGQLVVYPILDIDRFSIGLARYIFQLEESVIQSLLTYGIRAERVDGAAGIWLKQNGPERKICAIGVKASRNITMHGLAVNISTDLTYFQKIVPCGLANKPVTSLQQELKQPVDMNEYKDRFLVSFRRVFGVQSDTI